MKKSKVLLMQWFDFIKNKIKIINSLFYIFIEVGKTNITKQWNFVVYWMILLILIRIILIIFEFKFNYYLIFFFFCIFLFK